MSSFRREEGGFASHNGRDQLYYFSLLPDGPARGIVLIHHGMSGRSQSYEDLASALAAQGFAVYAYDCAGHGRSVADPACFGSFGDKDGDIVLVDDLSSFIALIRRRFRYLPLFLLGHSLGSFVVRAYLASHVDLTRASAGAAGDGERAAVDGAILSGTCAPFRLSRMADFSLRRAAKKGKREILVKKIFGDFEKRFAGEPGGWLTTEPETTFTPDDPLTGHGLTAAGFYDMLRLMRYISSPECFTDTPNALPLLFLSGERDPAGGMGQGIKTLCERLTDAGVNDITCRLYPGEKHELLNLVHCRETVRADLFAWLEEKTEAAVALRRQKV